MDQKPFSLEQKLRVHRDEFIGGIVFSTIMSFIIFFFIGYGVILIYIILLAFFYEHYRMNRNHLKNEMIREIMKS